MDLSRYQPGANKLIHHLDHLKLIKEGRVCGAIHLSFWPNAKCNLNCSYCCGRNVTDRSKEVSLEEYKSMLDVMVAKGLKAIEFSGIIGESTLWKYFNEGVREAWERGLSLSLITNGTTLKDIPDETLRMFDWIRISIQSVQHFNSIDFKRLQALTRVNTSYMVAECDVDMNKKLYSMYKNIEDKGIVMRVAVARPCSAVFENHIRHGVQSLGEPMFFSDKPSGTPDGCYMAWCRGAVDWNGNFYPCPSIQLNPENNGYIPEKYKLCHISELENWFEMNPPHDLGHRCTYCNCGYQNNQLIHNLIKGIDDVDFV